MLINLNLNKFYFILINFNLNKSCFDIKLTLLEVFFKNSHLVLHLDTFKIIQDGVSQPQLNWHFRQVHTLLWGWPLHCRMFSSISGLHPPEASINAPTETIKNVSKPSQISPGEQNCTQLQTTDLRLSLNSALNAKDILRQCLWVPACLCGNQTTHKSS